MILNCDCSRNFDFIMILGVARNDGKNTVNVVAIEIMI